MSLPITSLPSIASIPAIQPAAPSKAAGGEFASALTDAITRVEQFQHNSQNGIDKLLSGEEEEVHKVALNTQQAELAFDLFLQVRNKVVAAYQEVMRMQM